MKHVAINFHFAWDQTFNNGLHVYHVHINDQLADSLTNTLSRKLFLLQRSKISIYDGSTVLRGMIECDENILGLLAIF